MLNQFKGFSWSELAECWGLEVKEQPFIADITDGKMVILGNTPEEIEKVYHINGTTMKVTLTNEEKAQPEKIKQFIWSNIKDGHGKFKNLKYEQIFKTFFKTTYH